MTCTFLAAKYDPESVPGVDPETSYAIFLICMVELNYFLGCVFSTITFLLFRNCFKSKLIPENWKNQDSLNPDEETIEAYRDILDMF